MTWILGGIGLVLFAGVLVGAIRIVAAVAEFEAFEHEGDDEGSWAAMEV